MKSYDEYCAVAKALDVVGDRWTLLIVRELLLQGTCRFTDLKNALPGIATNLLSQRIKELEQHGLITKNDSPPPVATSVIELTERGAQLRQVVDSLAVWGINLMGEHKKTDNFRPQWFTFPIEKLLRPTVSSGETITLELDTPQGKAHARITKEHVHLLTQPTSNPDLTLSGEPNLILGVLTHKISLARAKTRGLQIIGDTAILTRLGAA